MARGHLGLNVKVTERLSCNGVATLVSLLVYQKPARVFQVLFSPMILACLSYLLSWLSGQHVEKSQVNHETYMSETPRLCFRY